MVATSLHYLYPEARRLQLLGVIVINCSCLILSIRQFLTSELMINVSIMAGVLVAKEANQPSMILLIISNPKEL